MLGSISCLSVPQRAQQLKRSAWLALAPQRLNSSLPLNIGVLFVPQQEAWVVERMGKFHRILEPVRSCFSALLGLAGSCSCGEAHALQEDSEDGQSTHAYSGRL